MNLESIINSLPIDFFFLVVDPHLGIKLPQLKNFYPIQQENLKLKNSGYLLSLESTQEFIKNITQQSGHQAAVISFKPSAKIKIFCQKFNWIYCANSPQINRYFEDKINFVNLISGSSIPTLPFTIGKFNLSFLNETAKKYNFPMVIQTHFGWAGKSTHLVTNLDFKSVPLDTLVKVSPLLKGYTLLNNCYLGNNGLIQSPPALQFTGLKPLTNNPFTTVGRQWPSLAPEIVKKQVFDITLSFSEILKKHNYRGFFGLDFFVSQEQVYLLECNPRLTASFAFYTEIELKNCLNPLFYFHLLEFTAPQLITNIQDEFRFDNQNLVGSEITLKNQSSQTVKKFQDFIPFSATTDPINIPSNIINKLING